MPQPLKPRILVTGFAPFGGETVNPSSQIAHALNGQHIADHLVVAGILPTVFDDSLQALGVQLRKHRPMLVVCVGQAGGRQAMSFERVAININDARIPDNEQQQPVDTPVVKGGPVGYFSSLPIKAMTQAAMAAGATAEVSQSAGTFVCNHVFYRLMHMLASTQNAPRAGFVHVPVLPEQQALHPLGQAMDLDMQVQGIRVALQAALSV